MEKKIQLQHRLGKHAVRIDADKYEPIEKALLYVLKNHGSLTHTELFAAVEDYFHQNNLQFEGSLDWYTQSVKMNLEAIHAIERTADKPQQYRLSIKPSANAF